MEQVLLTLRIAAVAVLALGLGCHAARHASDAGARKNGASTRDGGNAKPSVSASAGQAPSVRRRDASPPAEYSDLDMAVGWVPLPGLPDGCVVERAEHPEVLFEPSWVPCTPGVDGCLMVAPDPRFNRVFTRGTHDGARGYFGLVEGTPNSTSRITAVASTDGTVFGAWRDPGHQPGSVCSVQSLAVSVDAAGFEIDIWPVSQPEQIRLYHASLAKLRDITDPVAVLEQDVLHGSSVQHVAVSATTLAAQLELGGFIVVVEGGMAKRLADLPAPYAGDPQHVRVVGRDVLWESWGDSQVVLAHATIDTAPSVYYAPKARDAAMLCADGTSLIWTQAWDRPDPTGPYQQAELWTSPYAESPSDLSPRKVAVLPGLEDGTAGGGVFGFGRYENGVHSIQLYDLADGRHRVYVLPKDMVPSDPPLYMSQTEMLLVVNVKNSFTTALRVDLTKVPYDG